MYEAVSKIVPVKRVGEAHEIASMVAYLASDDAKYITGQMFVVDGGITIVGIGKTIREMAKLSAAQEK
jgi:NAD(P)-dependent dehydrogenase (short-subunit alcohol dehydrogenase family)